LTRNLALMRWYIFFQANTPKRAVTVSPERVPKSFELVGR